MPRRRLAGFAGPVWLGVLLIGCASESKRDGFEEVQRTVDERSGLRVVWNRGSAEDKRAVAAVRAMLQQELDADRAVQVALLNNRDMQATYESLGVAQADLVQAGLLRNPVVTGEIRFFGEGIGSYELSVVQNFIDVFLVPLKVRAAAAAFEAAKSKVSGAVIDLAADVRAALYRYQAAEQILEMRRSIVGATEASYDLSQRMHDAGNITNLDLDSEHALHEQARLDLTESEADAATARERLNGLMGLAGADTNWKIAGRLPAVPSVGESAGELELRAVKRNLDVEAARRGINVAAEKLGIVRPMAVFGEGNAGVSIDGEPEAGNWGVGPAFALPIPIIDTGQPAAARAAAELRAAEQRYRAMQVRVRAEVRAAHARMISAGSRAKRYVDVVLPLRQRILEETQREYNGMLVGTFQLLLAKQQQIEAGRQSIEAQRDYWVARTELERIVGGRLSSGGDAERAPSASGSAAGEMRGGH